MIMNLTQHAATPDQIEAGVRDLEGSALLHLKGFLEFDAPPKAREILDRAHNIADLAARAGAEKAMIGGALWLMAPLAERLRGRGIEPMYAFSRRETVEEAQADGTVRKVAVFKFAGWVPVVE